MKRIISFSVLVLLWLSVCTSVGNAESDPPLLPVVILQHSDGTQIWGRVIVLNDDSLVVRRMEDLHSVTVEPEKVVRVYRVERKSSNIPLSILSGTLVMAGTWAAVAAVNDGKITSGSAIMAGAIGAVPSVFAAVTVSNWTRKYRIIPLDVLDPQGTLDLHRMKMVLQQ